MLSEVLASAALERLGLRLQPPQIEKVLTYLELLLHWNQRINLTSIRSPEECLTKHFGESLYLSLAAKLEGRLLDVGSGAGFPGLALKIAFPELSVVLLEPIGKKRAFLKEVARTCGMNSVQVRPERLEQFASSDTGIPFETVTARAVGELHRLVPLAARCLRPSGRLCVWVSERQAAQFTKTTPEFQWLPPVSLPTRRSRQIWIGRLEAPVVAHG